MENILENIDLSKVTNVVLAYVPKIVMVLLTLVIGLWLIKLVLKGVKKLFASRDFDQTLENFLLSLAGMTLKVLLGITVISMLGVQMTSFIALLGAAGLAVGMALSGTLQNFAGGVMLLIFRPYKIGDVITTQGHTGAVKEIQIFNTVLNTPDGQTVFVPNAPISNNSLINYSTEGKRRVDLSVGIDYAADIEQARSVILGIMNNDSRILSDPAPFVGVETLADSSVNLAVRPWCLVADYWDVYFDTNEKVKNILDKNNISIPFPQSVVHMKQSEL